MLTEGDRQMLSMQLSNIPFYVLERQKCVNLRVTEHFPPGGLLDFRIQAEDFTNINKTNI